MNAIESPAKRDPLAAYMTGAFAGPGGKPIPLADTEYVVTIEAGLAQVVTRRVFRNAEEHSIEATITFPVPLSAVLYSLSARINGRLLLARAARKEAARETYEEAVDEGKSAVLHEEVLKGVHQLSVAHVPPGAEIEVETIWSQPLSVIGGKGRLRIPLTVGDIYGRSPLNPEDDLVTGGVPQTGRLKISAEGEKAWLHEKPIGSADTVIPLNRPIDIAVPLWKPLARRSGEYELTITPLAPFAAAMDLCILVDHSGSMNEIASLLPGRLSSHQVVCRALSNTAQRLQDADRISLWEFDSTPQPVGIVTRADKSAIARLSPPQGGTCIGVAVEAAIANEPESDILLITDGNSYDLDVTALARHKRRISVVLIGEESLEANVGHLAALTGGDVFVATEVDATSAIEACFASIRANNAKTEIGEVRRGGVAIEWRKGAPGSSVENQAFPAINALCASLEMNHLSNDKAAALAERYGLVTHLTSLVLVDEAGERQQGLPQLRKVTLPEPAVHSLKSFALNSMRLFASDLSYHSAPSRRVQSRKTMHHEIFDETMAPGVDLRALALRLNWSVNTAGLEAGELAAITARDPSDIVDLLEELDELSERLEIKLLANRLGIDPLTALIWVLALQLRKTNRYAARILKGKSMEELEAFTM